MPRILRAKPRPTRYTAIGSRAWTVAQELRARHGWLLDQASVQRSWSAHFGAAAFEISAHVLLLFDGPCTVVALTSSFPKAMLGATAKEVIQHLRASLGERYRSDPTGDRLVTAVRTDKPRQLLAEIANVEHVLGGRAARRLGPSPRSQDRRRWHVVEALRASSWLTGSLSFTRKIGDEHRHLGASIGVLVDSASGRPGLAANFAGWVPRTNKRWTQFCDNTAVGLTAEGFRVNEQEPCSFHFGRWVAGLSGTRALKQADAFDQLIEAGADVVN